MSIEFLRLVALACTGGVCYNFGSGEKHPESARDARKRVFAFFAKHLGELVDWFGYAAPRISETLEKRGGQVAVPPEGFYVGGTEGPLLDGELEQAAQWARQIALK